jgi:hypothetical protein
LWVELPPGQLSTSLSLRSHTIGDVAIFERVVVGVVFSPKLRARKEKDYLMIATCKDNLLARISSLSPDLEKVSTPKKIKTLFKSALHCTFFLYAFL